MDRKNKVALTFALYHDGALVRRETLTQDIVKVGKDPKSHLRVDDEAASRMHAVLEVASASEITLIDLGNDPGTLLNGARVSKSLVKPGDQIQIGGTRIVLERAEPVAMAMPAPVPSANPFAAAQNPRTGQAPHRGDVRRHTVAPSSIIAWLWSPGAAGLTSSCASGAKAFDADALSAWAVPSRVRRARIRTTLPSTHARASPKAMLAIAADV